MFRALHMIRQDVQAIFERDPAARNLVEVVAAYPGLHALWLHRLAHRMHLASIPVLPRVISHLARFLTGIEIHPGARIGRSFFIDHGMGVVIGETAEIGDNVTLYQGVTLGIYHTRDVRRLRGAKRHPTLRDGVTVGVGAKILGAITVNEGATIGAGSVVLHDVPAHTTVVGNPGRVVVERDPQTGEKRRIGSAQLRTVDLPDPVLDVIRCLYDRVHELEARLEAVEISGTPLMHVPARRQNGARENGAANAPCRDEIERALRASMSGLEGRDPAA